MGVFTVGQPQKKCYIVKNTMGGPATRGEFILYVAGALLLLTVAIGLLFGIYFGVSALFSSVYFWTSAKMWSLCVLFFFPSFLFYKLSRYSESIWMLTVLHWLVILIIFYVCTKWFQIPVKWLIFAAGSYLVNHLAGITIDYYNERLVTRYSKSTNVTLSSIWDPEFKEFVNGQKLVYLAIPFGFFAALALGVFMKYDAPRIFPLAIKCTLVTGCLFQLVVLIYSFVKIIQPLVEPNESGFPKVGNFWSQYLTVGKTAQPATILLDAGIVITDLRKLLFYNITLNAIMFCSMLFLLFLVNDYQPTLRMTLIFFLAAIFVFSQIPYALGQNNMHAVLVGDKEGIEREELKDKLQKYAGLVPRFPFLLSLISGFTAGGLLFFIVENMIKETIK